MTPRFPMPSRETHGAEECCTNTDGCFKSINNNGGSMDYTYANTLTNYFLPCPNIAIDKRRNTELI